jgi:hypothetical protein
MMNIRGGVHPCDADHTGDPGVFDLIPNQVAKVSPD